MINEKKELQDLKAKLRFTKVDKNTEVTAIAISKTISNNNYKVISCNKGRYLNNVVYDITKDCYYIECLDFLPIGEVPISFEVEMDGIFGWKVDLPIPEVVFRRYLSEDDKKHYDEWKAQFDKDVEFYLVETLV